MNNVKSILTVGSIALDTLETVNGNRENILGGSASYFSIAASTLAPVKIVGVIGDDFPEDGKKLFQSRNINTDNVLVNPGKTFRWGGRYSADYSTRDTLFTELGVFEEFSPSIKREDRETPLVFLGNIQPDLQSAVARLTPNAEYIVSDTMNLWIDLFPDKLEDVFSLSNVLLINHEEAEQFTGESVLPRAANKLLSYGPDIVVIKRGSDGAFLASRKGEYYVPVFPVDNIIDPTGAGDTFAGGFMGCIANAPEPDLLEAVITGSAMASFCVEGFGLESLLKVTHATLTGRIEIIKNSMLEKTQI